MDLTVKESQHQFVDNSFSFVIAATGAARLHRPVGDLHVGDAEVARPVRHHDVGSVERQCDDSVGHDPAGGPSKDRREMTTVESDTNTVDTSWRPSPDWRDHANCKGQLKLFFAKNAERPQARARREAKAKKLCDSCPVFDECRQFARRNREYGYWAGESEEDRHLLGFRVTAPIGARVRRPARDTERESA